MKHRIGALAVLLTSTCLSSTGRAQAVFTAPPPIHYRFARNNMDRISGKVLFAKRELSIGPDGPGGLSYISYHVSGGLPRSTNWDIILYVSGNTYSAATSDAVSEVFTRSGNSFTSQSADGATMSVSGSIYTMTQADGTQIKYGYSATATVRATSFARGR